jgi:hypothetical protein
MSFGFLIHPVSSVTVPPEPVVPLTSPWLGPQ